MNKTKNDSFWVNFLGPNLAKNIALYYNSVKVLSKIGLPHFVLNQPNLRKTRFSFQVELIFSG